MTGGVLAGLAGANPLGAMTAAQNETQNNWAAHIGLSGSVTFRGLTYTGGWALQQTTREMSAGTQRSIKTTSLA